MVKKNIVKSGKNTMTDKDVERLTGFIMDLTTRAISDPSIEMRIASEVRMKKIEAIKFSMEIIAKI